MRRRSVLRLVLVLAFLLPAAARAAIPTSERAALLAIYASAGGPGWSDRTGWGGSPGTECSWARVRCDDAGSAVVGLELGGNNLVGTPLLGGLPKLTRLDLGGNPLGGSIPPGIASLSSLQSVTITGAGLTGSIPRTLGGLASLRSLWLNGNQLSGEIPAELGSLSQLEELSLYSNELTGQIPASLGGLSRLRTLYLGYNRLTGSIPSELGALGAVVDLHLLGNRLTGPIPSTFSGLASVESLTLASNQLSGAIPDVFGGLKKLSMLDLSDNAGLGGAAPASLSALTALDSLSLAGTGLTDVSAVDWSKLVRLRQLALGGNKLSGPVPESLGRIPTLLRLDLWGNGLTGSLPASFASLTALEQLGVGSNQLTDLSGDVLGGLPKLDSLWAGGNPLNGPFPAGLARSRSLRFVDLSGCGLTGALPAALGDLATLEELRLPWNALSGALPAALGTLARLRVLGLAQNRLTGEVPASVQGLRALTELDLAGNGLTGPIPPELATLPALSGVDLSRNQLSGPIPAGLGSMPALSWLDLHENQLTGSIPPELGGLAKLTYLDLGGNQLTGPIPPELGQLTELQGLGLDENRLTGALPASFGSLGKLVGLDVSGNQLGGELPAQLGDLALLQYLYVGGNQIGGSIPPSLGKLSALRELSLQGNLLSGGIPATLGALGSLEILELQANQLTGGLPSDLGALGALRRLYAGYNQLSGSLPASFGALSALELLDLERNQLSGPLPAAVGRLGALRWVELGGNRLSGEIPREVGSLASVEYLGLWGNQLSGPLPSALSSLVKLYDGWGLALSWNALRTEDAALRDFVVRKGGSFDRTQTVAPTLLDVAAVSTNQVTLRWSPILYQDDAGGYQVLGSVASTGSSQVLATTASKQADSATVSGLLPGRAYTFAVRSFTRPHAHNDSVLVSEAGDSVTAQTSASGSVLVAIGPTSVRVLPGGTAPMTLSLSPAQAGAVTVSLSVSNASFVTVPASVTVPAGAGSAPFNATGVREGAAIVVARLPEALGGTAAIADVVVDTSVCERPEVPAFRNAAQATIRAGNPVTLSWTDTLDGARGAVYQVDVTTNPDCTTGRVRLVTPGPSVSVRTEKVAGTVCAVVRAVSALGCASGDSQPVRVTVQPAPAAFVVSQAQRQASVTSVGVPAADGTVVFKNVGSQAAKLTVASRSGLFTPKPASFDSVAPGATATVTLVFDPLTSVTQSLGLDALCGSWNDGEATRSACTAVTLTTLASPPTTSSAGARLELVDTNEVHFIAPKGQTPPAQIVTVANRGTAPVRIAPSIGPGGAWLSVAQADLATPLPPGQTRTFLLQVDRSRRSTADGPAPVTTDLVLAGVDGPEGSRPKAILSVFDEETAEVGSGVDRPFLASRDFSLFLATGVSAPGRGTYFLSDGWIKNKGSAAAQVDLYYTPNGGDGIGHPGVKRASVTLSPYQTYRLADFVRGLFGTTGSGAVELRSPQIADLSVRTTVDSLTVKPTGLARFGAEIPTVRSREGVGLGRNGGAPFLLPGIRGGAGSAFRTNLILAETSGRPLRVGLRLLAPGGTVLRETELVVSAYSKQQVNATDDSLFPQDAAYDGATLEVRPLEGSGTVAAFATVLDNASQAYAMRLGAPAREATQAPSSAGGARAGKGSLSLPAFDRLVVPAVARAQGRNDSFFTTALSMTNGTAGDAKVTLRYLPDAGAPPTDVPVTVPGRQSVSYGDVLLEVFGLQPSTAGMLTIEGGDVKKLVVASETSTPLSPEDLAKGASPATLAAYAPESSQAIGDPGQGLPSAVVSHPGLEESSRFRTNLILAETGGQPARLRVRLFLPASGGVPLAEKEYDLAAFQRLQVNKFILDVAGTEEGAVEYLDVETSVEWLSGSGRVLAVATKIDNDPESKRTDIYVLGPVGSAQGTIGF